MSSELLLHTCCAGCLLHPLNELRSSGYRVTAFFYNPNIHPSREMLARLTSLQEVAEAEGLPLITGDYAPADYFRAVRGRGEDTPARCTVCYDLRLAETARRAADLRIPIFSTTLLVSIYQSFDQIVRAGEWAGRVAGVEFLSRDFRGGFRPAQRRARDLGLYRQSYCGCVFSELERYQKKVAAALQRAEDSPPTPVREPQTEGRSTR